MRIIDISKPLRCGEEIACEIPADRPVYEGFPCEEYRFEFRSHLGCYFETDAHLFRGGTLTCDVPIEKLFLPALVARLDAARGGVIEPDEITAALREEMRPGDALIADTQGRQDRWFSRSAGVWMVERKIALLGATLPKYDTGFENPTGVFVELFRAHIPILAGIENVHQIAHQRVFLIVMPMKIEGVCTAPCRAVVFESETEEIEALALALRGSAA
jgi:kynurenine formamidase